MATDEFDKLLPRQEAIPLTWEGPGGLTTTQQRAASQLWALFRNYYLDEAPSKSRHHRPKPRDFDRVLPTIAHKRRNQIILIDGERGSGKTALLITLIDAWNQAFRREASPDLDAICDPHGRVLPIGLLDLRSLPNHTSLLIHISGLLRGVVEELGIHRATPPPPTSPHHEGSSEAQHAWQRFLAAAASTQLRIGQRSAELDPETFAQELHETEQDRLHVGELFGQLMDHLVECLEDRRRRERGHASDRQDTPVFVIAIDDADMNPARLGECFELLDSFVHPRLVFILTGVSKLFITGLRAQFLGDLRRPLAKSRPSEAEHARLGDFDEALELAERYYDKLIPPSHRCALPKLPEGGRIERLRPQLEAIPLGGASVCTIFDRVPGLGALLPDTLRGIADFRLKLGECGGDRGALEFLLLIKDRVARQLGARPEFDVGELITPVSQQLFGQESSFEISTKSLEVQLGMSAYAIRKADPWFGRIELHHVTRHEVAALPHDLEEDAEDPEERPAAAMLDQRIPWLAVLIEYIGPHLNHASATFDPGAQIRLRPFLTTTFSVPNFGKFGAWWPLPRGHLSRRRVYELARYWRRILEEIVGRQNAAFDDGQLELLAINYIRAITHATDAKVEVSDPPILCPVIGDREATWRTTIEQARAGGSVLAGWIDVEMLELAYPESRLGNGAARRLLSAWAADRDESDSLLAQADNRRWGYLKARVVQKKKLSPTALWTQLNERFEGHPWIERTGSFIADEMTRLRTALANIPIAVTPGPSWLPTTAAGYLTHRAEELLSRAAPDVLKSIRQALEYYFKKTDNPLLTLFHAWQASDPRDKEALSWGDFTITSPRGPGIYGGAPISKKPIISAVRNVECVLHRGQLHEPADEPAALAMFRLAYDAAHDDQYQHRDGSADWSLFHTYWRASGQRVDPWPAVKWLTFIDYDIISERWRQITDGIEASPDMLGVIARRYVEAQISTFSQRRVQPLAPTVMTWPELFESARDAHMPGPVSAPRSRAFGGWILDLYKFGGPSAALPEAEAAAALVAYFEILTPMRPAGGFWSIDGEVFDRQDPPEALEAHPWCQIETPRNHQQRRATAAKLRAFYQHEAPEQFMPPVNRRPAAEAFREVLSTIDLPGPTSLPNVGAYLGADLLEITLGVYTGAIHRVTKALNSSSETTARLLAAWRDCVPDTPTAVGHDGLRWQVEGHYQIKAQGTNTRRCPAALGIEYTLGRGDIEGSVGEELAAIIHALIHDVATDTQPTGEQQAPIEWPLAQIGRDDLGYKPWPAVQWPTRHDSRLQLSSWWADFAHRTQDNAESLSGRMRAFVAATAHVYRTRAVFERAAGSWQEVIRATWDALEAVGSDGSDRRLAYAAWVAELPRLALPRAGLTHKHAADVLVRHFDITAQDPRPQLVGRIYETRQRDLGLHDRVSDHPAVLLAECETDTQLAETIETLRKHYELS